MSLSTLRDEAAAICTAAGFTTMKHDTEATARRWEQQNRTAAKLAAVLIALNPFPTSAPDTAIMQILITTEAADKQAEMTTLRAALLTAGSYTALVPTACVPDAPEETMNDGVSSRTTQRLTLFA